MSDALSATGVDEARAYVLWADNIQAKARALLVDIDDALKLRERTLLSSSRKVLEACCDSLAEALNASEPPITFLRSAGGRPEMGCGVKSLSGNRPNFSAGAVAGTGPEQVMLSDVDAAREAWAREEGFDSAHEMADRARIGEALLDALPDDYRYLNCPSEIVADLLSRIADLLPQSEVPE